MFINISCMLKYVYEVWVSFTFGEWFFSAAVCFVIQSNHEHLFLQGEDKLYLSTEETIPHVPVGEGDNSDIGQSAFLMNKQWQIVPIPHIYLSQNWPVRFAAVNKSGHLVAVAGKTGLAHYALFSRKWKLFGNETQVRLCHIHLYIALYMY